MTKMFWCEMQSFVDIGSRYFSLFYNMMELDCARLVALKARNVASQKSVVTQQPSLF